MKHPNQAALALYAGGDLGFIAQWKTGRHLANCERCRDEAAAYEMMRESLPELAETPDVPWSRLAAEMKANIRLGVAAGECVRSEQPLRETPLFTGARAAVAFASVVALLTAVLVLQRPAPMVAQAGGVEVQSMANGIQIREGRETLRLLHTGADAKDVTYVPSAQGSMRASYVDTQTGLLTVQNIYAD